MDTVKWRKHPTREDILVRDLSPVQQQNEVLLEALAEEEERKRESRRWMRVIPNLKWKKVERLARHSCPLGGKITDVVFNHATVVQVEDRYYATRTLGLYVEYDLEDEKKGRSDCLMVVLFRDPVNPRHLCLTLGRLPSAVDLPKAKKRRAA